MKKYIISGIFLLLAAITALATEVSTNNWYVGNTQPGEWLKFKKVWLTAGNYRFTTNAVSKDGTQTVHLEINNIPLNMNVAVPSNETNSFELVHLGYRNLAEGYYDIKLVFETGQVNCDMIFIRKSDSTEEYVLEDDTRFTINSTDGPHIAPIGGAINSSSQLAKGTDSGDSGSWKDAQGNYFSRHQMLSWYKQQMYAYTPENTDQAMDYYVSEQVEAKVDFIFAHGRGDIDFENDIEDRAYRTSAGGYFGCRLLRRLVEAIDRNHFAKDNLKIGFFSDNSVFPWIFRQKYPDITFAWDDPQAQEVIWKHVIEPFYDNVPERMLFFDKDGKTPLQLWTSNANYDYGNVPRGERKIKEFLEDIGNRMQNKYGFRPAWILAEDFYHNDTRLKTWDQATGTQAWFVWGGNITSMVTCPTNNRKYAFALNGGRHPLGNRWLNDWDPITNTGTQAAHHTTDYHRSALDENGNPVIREIYERAIRENAEWVVLESWCDWSEGSTWYRSDHPEYAFPNQHMALVREFADRNSESIVLEVEGCDEYYNRTPGNRGGTYRVNWYNDLEKDFWKANMEIDLDIYRPLHKLTAFVEQGRPSEYIAITDFAVGNKDLWAISAVDKRLYAHQVDGKPAKNWKQPSSQMSVKKLGLGGNYIWGLMNDNKLYWSEIPDGETHHHRGWKQEISRGLTIKDIAVSFKDAWALDSEGNLYYSDLAAKNPWIKVPGKLKSLAAAEDQSVWGFTLTDDLVRMSSESKNAWDTIPNPHRLTKLSAGSSEVWGVNTANELYRINSSGDGEWRLVGAGYKNVGVGIEFVWVEDTNGNFFNCKMSGFEDRTVFSNLHLHTDMDAPTHITETINVYPSGFVDRLNVEIYNDKAEDFILTLTDISGNTSIIQPVYSEAGINTFTLDGLESLNKGMYILTVKSNSTIKSFKVIKTR